MKWPQSSANGLPRNSPDWRLQQLAMTRAWDELQQIAAVAAELYPHDPGQGIAAAAGGLHLAVRQLILETWTEGHALNPALTLDVENRSEQLQIQKTPAGERGLISCPVPGSNQRHPACKAGALPLS